MHKNIFSSSFKAGQAVAVLLPVRPGYAFDYRVPASVPEVHTGECVRVKFRSRQVSGVVWGAGTSSLALDRLKEIDHVHHVPRFQVSLMSFIQWVAQYTLTPPGMVLRMVLSTPRALEPLKGPTKYIVAGDDLPQRMTVARSAVVEVCAPLKTPLSIGEIAKVAGASSGIVRGMVKAGILVAAPQDENLRECLTSPRTTMDSKAAINFDGVLDQGKVTKPTLSDNQKKAAAHLVQGVEEKKFAPIVLDGVTGSGKTEVYYEAIEVALQQNQQVLVLLPEISLTSQWLTRFQNRFNLTPFLWHSGITQGQRKRIWRVCAHGQASVVVGARSALFLPFKSLGLIIVDEEHDSSFKQEEGVIYHGRDMAVVRAREEGISIILVSATPSLETMVNVTSGRYKSLSLPSRHGVSVFPHVVLVDMVKMPPERGKWLASSIVTALKKGMERGEQSALFLNRRGYAPLTLCRSCGHRFFCPNCSTWLVQHKSVGRLVCHYCSYQISEPEKCPECRETDSFVACGPGVERIADEVTAYFPDARIQIMTSDTVSDIEKVTEIVRSMEEGKIDILIGTQIIAKGYHFPKLTTVGVVDGDLGLAGGDLRAAERTYQVLHQVAGRAGRAEAKGDVYIQTYQPHHPVMGAMLSGDRDNFYKEEVTARKMTHMPPFSKLASLIISGESEQNVIGTARSFAESVPYKEGVEMFGPVAAPLSKLRGKYRWRLLLRTKKEINIQGIIQAWWQSYGKKNVKNAAIKVVFDIDPYSFL